MPFGATAAVTRFNRCSAALEYIMADQLHVASSSYFDDFSVLTPSPLAKSTDAVVKDFFDLIGWPIKTAKDRPFEPAFKALGVIFDFSGSDGSGVLRCGNTPERVDELRAALGDVLDSNVLSAPLAGHIAGRLIFARSQTFGRCGGVAASHIHRRAREHGALRLDDKLRWAITWWRDYFASAKPRLVFVGRPLPPVLVWTDGAHEEDSLTPTTCGAFLVDKLKGVKECFGIPVPEAIREAWKVSLALDDPKFYF